MTPAELKTLRESLGLTAQWVADQAGVKLRTVQYWESGRTPVPADVQALIVSIDANLENAVSQSVDQVSTLIAVQGATPEDIVLVRYRTDEDLWRFMPEMRPLPCTTHAMLLARTRRAMDGMGIATSIVYMEPEAYLAWLGNRSDDSSARAEWASLQTGG